jgi:hypothetical protein
MSPRGNDAEAAGTELQARTGEAPNAETMIAENAARWPAALRAANNRPLDQAATDELDEDEVAGMVEAEGEITVLGFAVRGPFVVVVYEDEDGQVVKEAVQRKGHEKQAERLAPAEPDPEEADKEAQKEAEAAARDAEKAEKEAEKAAEGHGAQARRPAAR